MDKIILNAKTRSESDKNSNKIRREGSIPAVTYGSGDESKSVIVDLVEFNKVYKAAGENTIIEVTIDGKDKMDVLIHATQLDPISGEFTHADFFKVDMTKKIETEIPLVFSGEAPAVKELGGVFVRGIDSVTVRCLPGNIPHEFAVDLSVLKTFDDHIAIKDLNISSDVESVVSEETIIASVAPPRSEAELDELDEKIEEDVSNVEGATEAGETEETEKAEKAE
ncbi:50S ribosomal protein L25 [Patescibacteria group bacterium]